MPKTLTIELPDNLQEHLGLPIDAPDDSIKDLILKNLNTLATLIGALHNTDPILRAQAAIKLGNMQAENAVDVLAQSLQDENLIVRSSVTEALRKIGTDKAITLLAQHNSEKSYDSETDLDYEPLLSLAGTLDIGTTDLGENHDKYIAEALERELRPDD
ncbi:MAG: HEAT repeat domain-containing protein [Cyanobacteria bacterium J06634_6]